MKSFKIYLKGTKPITQKGKTIEIKDGIATIKNENGKIVDYYKEWNNIKEICEGEKFEDLP